MPDEDERPLDYQTPTPRPSRLGNQTLGRALLVFWAFGLIVAVLLGLMCAGVLPLGPP